MTMKYPELKKDALSEIERDFGGPLKNMVGRMDSKNLPLMRGSTGTWEIGGKKNGHMYTYTNLNDSDKLSEIDSSYSLKFR